MGQEIPIIVIPKDELTRIIEHAVCRALSAAVPVKTQESHVGMNAAEVARYLRIRKETVLTALRDGTLRGRQVRGTWQVRTRDADDWHRSLE